MGDCPGGVVDNNLPVNAGDTGSIPGPGRSHMPRSNWVHAPQLLSQSATATEAHAPRACISQQEKPPQCDTCAPQLKRRPPLLAAKESQSPSRKIQHSQK